MSGLTRTRLRRRRIVCLGDSLTKRGTPSVNWPAFDFGQRAGLYAYPINEGVSGNIVQDCINRFNADVKPFRPRDVVVWVGINDVKFGAESNLGDPSVIEAGLTSLYTSVLAINARPIGVTISPWAGGFWNANRETTRGLLNTWIKANTSITPVDVEPALADSTDPSHPILRAQYDNGDGTHINNAGAVAVAGAIFAQAYGRPVQRP